MNSERNFEAEQLLDIEKVNGLPEIQEALAEIEKLQNQHHDQDSNELERDEEDDAEKNFEEDGADLEEEVKRTAEKKEGKLWKEKKRKYQAIAEKEALFQENLQLKQMLSESLNSGTYHYGKSAYSDFERAKESKRKAIEDGNLDDLLEADIALTKSINTISELEKWASNANQSNLETTDHNNEQQNFRYSEREQEIAKDWLDEHPYLSQSSTQYNPKFANKVADFINQLDENLINHGEQDAYFSQQYFDAIDNYIEQVKKTASKTAKNIESITPVGGVRNSYATSSNGKSSNSIQMTLSADEKKMCANAGISEKEWLKYKLDDLKKGK